MTEQDREVIAQLGRECETELSYAWAALELHADGDAAGKHFLLSRSCSRAAFVVAAGGAE